MSADRAARIPVEDVCCACGLNRAACARHQAANTCDQDPVCDRCGEGTGTVCKRMLDTKAEGISETLMLCDECHAMELEEREEPEPDDDPDDEPDYDRDGDHHHQMAERLKETR